ncbi:MAG: sigma-70 family RNA polymerase sigma factor [Planctomycetota bacterium]|jgi:RNA polymerase sigma factor for flagellar operon FliA
MPTALEGRARALRAHEDNTAPDAVARLWRDYQRERSDAVRDRLVDYYMSGHVRRIAARVHASLPQQVDLEDLVQEGYLGLIDAMKRFDTERDVRFETFSGRRIYGAIQDYLREIDPAPRLTRSRAKLLDRIVESFQSTHGRPPDEDELRTLLQLPDRVFRRLMNRPRPGAMVSFSSVHPDGDWDESDADGMTAFTDRGQPSPLGRAEHEDLRHWITRGLPRRDQLIITLYYYEELTMREVGDALGISESRVSQLLDEILGCLRSRLGYADGDESFG